MLVLKSRLSGVRQCVVSSAPAGRLQWCPKGETLARTHQLKRGLPTYIIVVSGFSLWNSDAWFERERDDSWFVIAGDTGHRAADTDALHLAMLVEGGRPSQATQCPAIRAVLQLLEN
jgi:hypothetical protein